MFLIFLVSAVLSLSAADPYVPGTPGAPWTEEQILIMKAKFFHFFGNCDCAPKVLRLGFHDCIKYADGTGGCDGCLNWHGMDVELEPKDGSRSLPVEAGAGNNGLGNTVRQLEQIYTEKNYLREGPILPATPKELGWSRADLWAFGSMMAVEFSIMVNNAKCDEKDVSAGGASWDGCSHHVGDPWCHVNIERPFRFQTGRSDCTEHDEEFPYKATKEEKHPDSQAEGKKTIEYFQSEFPELTGRDIVALFGAHTIGQPHFWISQFPYKWTSHGSRIFNNDYYRSIIGEDRWFYNAEPWNQCVKIGNAFGEKPKTQWNAHARMTNVQGGPVFWIKRNHVCPACPLEQDLLNMPLKLQPWEVDCCNNKPEGAFCRPDRESADMEDDNLHDGCERMRFISGADEIALNCEMGLYKDFKVDDDGVIFGCRGLEVFNASMRGTANSVWSTPPGGWGPMEPECGKQMIEYPAGSGDPLYSIFEEYAAKQENFIHDFVIAMEKMTANGYPEGLTNAPDHWTGVTCVEPLDINTAVTCFKPEAAGSGEPMFFQSQSSKTPGWALQHDEDTGKLLVGPVEDAENPTLWQQWVWSESGAQLINLGTGIPMAVDGFSSFKPVTVGNWPDITTQIRSTYNPILALDTYFAPINEHNKPPYRIAVYWAHGAGAENQQWNVTTITDCVSTAVTYGSDFQFVSVAQKAKAKVLAETSPNTVTVQKSSDATWKWASDSCYPEKRYLVSSSSGLYLAADGMTLTEELKGNTWIYDEVEKTLLGEHGGYLSNSKKKGQSIKSMQRTADDKPWAWFQWDVKGNTDCVPTAVPYGDEFLMINVMKKIGTRILAETSPNTASMVKTTSAKWKWASNSCYPEQKYLVSSSSGLVLAADGKTLTKELEGNSWIYDEVEKTLQNENGDYLSDRKRKGQTVRGMRRNAEDNPWMWFQWNSV